MSVITLFDPWKNRLCTCPVKYSLSAYTGCSHECLYCYASSYIPDFSKPRCKKDFLKKLQNSIKKIPPLSIITISNSSDPYQELEAKHKLTLQALEILSASNFKINIVTKSALILRDRLFLKKIKNMLVCISLTSPDERISRKLEPKASPVSQRLKALKILSSYLPVAVRLDPLIYGLNTSEIEKNVSILKKYGAAQIITSTYKIKPDNFRRMTRAFPGLKSTWQELYLKKGAKSGSYTYLEKALRKKLIKKVRDAALKEKIFFSSCREGFSDLNTAACDGSSLFTV